VIRAKDVQKSFGKFAVLRGVTFAIPPGRITALVGSNGTGKTTLMRCLLGVTRFEGEVKIGGVDVASRGKVARALVGYLPQSVSYPADWTARLAVAFVARVRRADAKRSLELIRAVGLSGHEDRPVAIFSGGMRRRLGLALALVGEPPVLLMDEPTANLDAAGREDLLDVVRGLKDGRRTVLFCSHREDEVAEVADGVLALAGGVVSDRGPPRTIESGVTLLRPPQGQRAAVLAALRRAGLEARPRELGLALIEVETVRLDALRPRLEAALEGTTVVTFEEETVRHA
jgi:ABC-type multidrug transport system ATPase subunit